MLFLIAVLPQLRATTRRIWRVKANTPVSLSAGTYWIKYQLQNVVTANGSFFPPVTIQGTRGLAGWNAKQYNVINNIWTPLIDLGIPDSAPGYPMDMPFVINFTTGSLGTNDVLQYDNRLQIYPNPVSDYFKISNPNNIKISSLEVVDASGRVVKELKYSDEYNVSDLQKGSCLLKIKSDETTKVTKLIKQ